MTIRKSSELRYSQVTPKKDYLNRRHFLASSIALGALAGVPSARATTKLNGVSKSPFSTDEKPTPFDAITHYNNFYEFGTDKEDPVAQRAGSSSPRPGPCASKAKWPSPRRSISTRS